MTSVIVEEISYDVKCHIAKKLAHIVPVDIGTVNEPINR